MPIKGLTDQAAAFPQIGILRKGDKKTGNAPGKDLTYFRFTSDDPLALATFGSAYGEQPTDIHIVLPYMTTEQNFHAWQEHWVAGGLKHRCDSETCTIHQAPDGTYSHDPVPCPGGCKPVGRLSVILPVFRRLCYVTVLTTSKWDIIELNQNLLALEAARGDLRGIPMILSRRPRMISTPGKDGQRARREKWLLHIEAAPEWVERQIAAQKAAALPQLMAGPGPDIVADSDDDNGVEVDDATGEILDTTPPPGYETSEEDGQYIDWAEVADQGSIEDMFQARPAPASAKLALPANSRYPGKTLGDLLKVDIAYLETIAGSARSEMLRNGASEVLGWHRSQG